MQAGNEGVLDCQEAVEGWALKAVQKSSRMSEDVRNYLIQRFNDGAKTGNKAYPKQAEHEMKHIGNTTGGLLFQPYEWRTSKKIASFFSNLSKSQRAKNIDEGNHGIESEDEEPNIHDKNLQLLQLVIESQVQADHPILFQGHTLCQDQNPSIRYTEKGMFVAGRRSYWIQSKEGHFCSCTRQVHLHPPI